MFLIKALLMFKKHDVRRNISNLLRRITDAMLGFVALPYLFDRITALPFAH